MFKKGTFTVIALSVLLMVSACANVTSTREVGEAQPGDVSDKTYKLLIMDSQTGGHYDTIRQSLLTTLENLGYREGENLDVTYYAIDGSKEKGVEILQSELGNGYDVIYTGGTVMTTAAKEVAFDTSEQNFIFASVTDPVGVGVIDDFESSPKANFSGVSYPVSIKSRFTFIRQLMPDVKKIGLVYADFPQSRSYRSWIEDLLENDPEFQDLEVTFRAVPLITGEESKEQMVEAAREYVKELDPLVDVFISPNDDMGASPYFAPMVYETSSKPLVGLTQGDVLEHGGATMAIFPSHVSMGVQAAQMIHRLFSGESIQDIVPESPKNNGYAFDLTKAQEFGIEVPIGMIELAGDNIVQ